MISIEMTRASNRARAEHFARQIDGQSYLRFHTLICPTGGEWVVSATTLRTDDQAEAQGILNLVLYGLLSTAPTECPRCAAGLEHWEPSLR